MFLDQGNCERAVEGVTTTVATVVVMPRARLGVALAPRANELRLGMSMSIPAAAAARVARAAAAVVQEAQAQDSNLLGGHAATACPPD